LRDDPVGAAEDRRASPGRVLCPRLDGPRSLLALTVATAEGLLGLAEGAILATQEAGCAAIPRV